jgi:hypothetical protein
MNEHHFDRLHRLVANKVSEMNVARNDWLEDVLAGLLTNGVTTDEVEVLHHADGRLSVQVRSVERYSLNPPSLVLG